MKIIIRNRADIEKMSQSGFAENTAVISITDAKGDFANLSCKPTFLLQLAFDDIDNDVFADELGRRPTEEERHRLGQKYNMFSDKQAMEIATFYFEHKDAISTLICQCEHGQSRSAAVAAAIMEFRGRRGIDVFSHDSYYPNKVVFRGVLAALKTSIEK